MGKNRSGARLGRCSQIVEFFLLAFEPGSQKLLHLNGAHASLARHPDLKQSPIADIKDQKKSERGQKNPQEHPLHN